MSAPILPPPLNSKANEAFTHRLKCWAEHFDAIVSGEKRADVRAEEDRKFKAGDLLDITRTDREGKPTEPRVRIVVEVLHVERSAGPLNLIGVKLGDSEMSNRVAAIAVLSLAPRFSKYTDLPPAPAAASK